MERAENKIEIIERLKQQILSMQGFKAPIAQPISTNLGSMESAFPNQIFPGGVIHEFLSPDAESAAATSGFMAVLLSQLIGQGTGPCLWIGSKRTLFPPALAFFGIQPDRIIFIDLKMDKDILWTVEEALKCDALSAVVGEISEISFSESRRLQLAVEQSRVTGFMHCFNPDKIRNTTSVARWKISPIASVLEEGMPGIGHPRWKVELIKIRNGKPGTWYMEWHTDHFKYLTKPNLVASISLEKAG
ncbi:ImuA family protein [Pedobacter sp. MC2016-24]|uniref:ImuA family protein n=1 Tax=Pedobacter sp. MC2016-24 TaxID=2780090 RepID=UPI0018810AC3|nr:Error-prone repair protein ImuA [Pedobacter sp. MC2016-24]MBE9597806.1 Error-prone repair protein ImuA [Pedobacter sp. MC2016-24]